MTNNRDKWRRFVAGPYDGPCRRELTKKGMTPTTATDSITHIGSRTKTLFNDRSFAIMCTSSEFVWLVLKCFLTLFQDTEMDIQRN